MSAGPFVRRLHAGGTHGHVHLALLQLQSAPAKLVGVLYDLIDLVLFRENLAVSRGELITHGHTVHDESCLVRVGLERDFPAAFFQFFDAGDGSLFLLDVVCRVVLERAGSEAWA